MQLHEQLAHIRKEANINQSTLAKSLGVSQARISEYESGKREISMPTLRKWASTCGCSVEFIFSKLEK